MAPPQKIKLPLVTYSVDMISGEISSLNEQINEKKLQIIELTNNLQTATSELVSLQNQMMVVYIQQTGSFPPS